MYLSKLVLDPHSRRVRTEVARPYELHRTLMRAFPSAEEGPGRVLFRLDVDRESDSLILLVQSDKSPDWRPLEEPGNFLLEPSQSKLFSPVFHTRQTCRFRLRANPTVKRQGKRFGIVKEADQLAWLQRKGTAGGFEPFSVITITERNTTDRMTDRVGMPHNLTLYAVRFDGLLTVKDPVLLGQTLAQGVGSGKGFGFGLLSLAPVE